LTKNLFRVYHAPEYLTLCSTPHGHGENCPLDPLDTVDPVWYSSINEETNGHTKEGVKAMPLEGTTFTVTVDTAAKVYEIKVNRDNAVLLVDFIDEPTNGITRQITCALRNVKYVQHCSKYNENTLLHLYLTYEEFMQFSALIAKV
jgi:hypothetical protein